MNKKRYAKPETRIVPMKHHIGFLCASTFGTQSVNSFRSNGEDIGFVNEIDDDNDDI